MLYRKALFCITALLLFGVSAQAEEGVLVVQVSNALRQPVSGVVLSAAGDSSVGPPTDVAGKTRIRLAPQTRPGNEVELVLVRPEHLVFISPWNGRVIVPPFENSTQIVVTIVVAERGDRQLLENTTAQTAMAATVHSSSAATAAVGSLDERQRMSVKEAARVFGFSPEEVDRAIRGLGRKTADPYQLGLVALYEGNYPEATRQFAASVELKQKSGGPSGELADAQFFLGQSLTAQGKYREAASVYEQAAQLRPDHALTFIRLGLALHLAGDYKRAEEYHNQGLRLLEKQLGPDHPDVAFALHSLAMLYREQGRYTEAVPLFCRSLAIYEKSLGPKDTKVATTLNQLALLYTYQGKYGEAEPLSKRAVDIYEEKLPADHIDLASGLHTLAMIYTYEGKYGQAEPLYQRSLRIVEKRLGADHPFMAAGLGQLGLLYTYQGRYTDAEPLLNLALSINENRLGKEHPDVAIALHNLAFLYQHQARYAEAEPLLQRAVLITERARGVDHPALVNTLQSYADLLRKMNRGAEAEKLSERARKIISGNAQPNPKN